MHTSPDREWRAGRRVDFRIRVPPSRRKYVKILPNRTQVDAEYVSSVEPSTREKSQPRHLSLAQQRALNTYQKQDLWNSTVLCTVCTVHHQRGNQLECPPLCRGTETRHRTHTTWTAGQSCMIARLPQRQTNPQEARPCCCNGYIILKE